jgi:alginate O-acetyltransferase complex protein AlgI
MLFNSLHFVFFFIFVTTLYYTVGPRFRWLLLLIASCYFYASFIPAYLLILGCVIVVDYLAGICIERSSGSWKSGVLITSIVMNVGFLAFFKYFDFFGENLRLIFAGIGLPASGIPAFHSLFPGLVLPIGLSFHTFQSMSYTIEVYRGNQKAEYDFGIYALYVLFYPQLVAGPIERPQNVLWQFREKIKYDPENLRVGLWLIAWGMFKKVVIADRLAIVTDHAFGYSAQQNASTMLIAVFFYSIQIYCDFSGYSDIALGTARTMGFRLMTNFKAPYFSASVAEFWTRWHISLSTWFRDYIYIPLGGNRVNYSKYCFNVLLVFLLSGFWHGADWKFICWGVIHGIYLIAGRTLRTDTWFSAKKNAGAKRLIKLFNVLWTFLLVSLAWIFFRAESIGSALGIIAKLFTVSAYKCPDLVMNTGEFLLSLLLITILLLKDKYLSDYIPASRTFWPSFTFIAFLCYLFGMFGSNQFIYFQF